MTRPVLTWEAKDGLLKRRGRTPQDPSASPDVPFYGLASYNNDPTPYETLAGRPVGCHRLYAGNVSPAGVTAVINQCAAAVAAHRVPWVSFTPLPDTWANAKNGSLDAWAADVCARLGALNGPVMITWHHEPEGDQSPLSDYVAMCDRLYPISKPYPNLRVGPIMILYNYLYNSGVWGTLASLWPGAFNSGDFFGFDAYTGYLTARGGSWNQMRTAYFNQAAAFAKSKGKTWAVGEYGISAGAAAYNRSLTGGNANGTSGGDITWMRDAYQSCVDLGSCLALCYFDSAFNSTANVASAYTPQICEGSAAWPLINQTITVGGVTKTHYADPGTPSKKDVFVNILANSTPWRANW